MMQGRVNQNCEATLSIVVKNNATTQLVDAVIDTGFSGFLTLPAEIISTLAEPALCAYGVRSESALAKSLACK
jgi:predicted aspartyl protease